MARKTNLDGMGTPVAQAEQSSLCIYPDCKSLWVVSNTTKGEPGYCRAHAWVIFPTRYPKPENRMREPGED